MSNYHLLTESLIDEIAQLDRDSQADWLILSNSEEFPGRWGVDSLHPDFFFDFEDIIGQYRTLSPARLPEFIERANEAAYSIAFTEDPADALLVYEHLSDPPPFSLHSNLEHTVNGLLPWQLRGFNRLIRDEDISAGLVIWDTGTGKTAFIASAIRWHAEHGHPFDLALVVVKSNNKRDMQRKLKRLADIESVVIQGSPQQRWQIYEQIEMDLLDGKRVVAVTNYEKFREDADFFKFVVRKRNVLCFWDEMPTKLSNRATELYKAVKRSLYESFYSKPRPTWMRHWELTATPIENSPDGQFSCVNLIRPGYLGRVEDFHTAHVVHYNPKSRKPERWRDLDKLEVKLEHMTDRVSREDPEVAKFFPKVLSDTLIIDWHEKDRHVYDVLTGKAKEIVEADFSEANILALIQVMQMVCDAPSMVAQSAQNRDAFEALLRDAIDADDDLPRINGPRGSEVARMLLKALRTPPTDKHHTKFETWREILMEKHPSEKVLTYMTWSSYGYAPLTAKLDEWGISYITYEGQTQKQRDDAKDRFRADPDIRVFLSSDKGGDSIDLPEAAVGVNYNLPWKWTTKRQRMRNVRVDSSLGTNWWYDLVMADSYEERKLQIIERKHGYHKALFEGAAMETVESARMTRDDLLYMLLGSNDES